MREQEDNDLKEIYNYIKILLIVIISGFFAVAGLLGFLFGSLI